MGRSVVEQLRQLTALHESGALDDDDFARAKERLLAATEDTSASPAPTERTGSGALLPDTEVTDAPSRPTPVGVPPWETAGAADDEAGSSGSGEARPTERKNDSDSGAEVVSTPHHAGGEVAPRATAPADPSAPSTPEVEGPDSHTTRDGSGGEPRAAAEPPLPNPEPTAPSPHLSSSASRELRLTPGLLAALVASFLGVLLVGVLVGALLTSNQSSDPASEPTPGSADNDAAPGASEVTGDEPPELEPLEPDGQGVELTDVAWTDHLWTTSCTRSGDPETVGLSEAPTPGELWHNPDPDAEYLAGSTYTVKVNAAVYGELEVTGEVAVFMAECFFGNDSGFYVEVWMLDDEGQPQQLPTVLAYTKWDGTIDNVEIVDGALHVHTSEGAPDDETPHLTGYPVEVLTAWTFEGEQWVSEELARTDTTPTPAPSSAPECAEPGASSADTARCLVAAINAQDYETASEVAAPEVVDTLRSWREDSGPLEWDFDGCDWSTCSFYSPSLDPQYHGVLIEMGVELRGDDLLVAWIETFG